MITKTARELMELAPEIHFTNRQKGFWPTDRDKGEQVMLIISELSECLEAHRKNRWCKTGKVQVDLGHCPYEDNTEEEIHFFRNCFLDDVKDTIQDEMADVVIRMLDYIHGWQINFIEREYRKESTDNFGHDLLRINWYLLNAYHNHIDESRLPSSADPGKDWGYALAAVLRFCEWYGIDIVQHVQWKMRYNATREHMHGKAY